MVRKSKVDKKKRRFGLVRQPFLWIVIWMGLPFIFIFIIFPLIRVFDLNEKAPLLISLLENLSTIYLESTPLIFPSLAICSFVYGIVLLNRNEKKLFGIINLTLGIIAFLIIILFYWMLSSSITPGSCQDIYYEFYDLNQDVSDSEKAYLILQSFVNNESNDSNVIIKGQKDFLRKKIENLTLDDFILEQINVENELNNKEAWVVHGELYERLAIDRYGKIYQHLLCI